MPYGKKSKSKPGYKKPVGKSKAMASAKMQKRDFRFKGSQNNNIKPEPFPRVLYTRAKYAENAQFTVPAYGVTVARSYRVNSIYRPAFTSPWSTVAGWSQLSTLYDQYLVMGCKITVSFNNPSADGIRVGVLLRQGNNAPAVSLTLTQLANYNNVYISGLNNTGSQTKTFSFYVKPWSLLGINKLEYLANSSRYSSVMNDNPPYSGYIDVFAVQEDALVDVTAKVNYLVKVVYYVKCFERNQLNPS